MSKKWCNKSNGQNSILKNNKTNNYIWIYREGPREMIATTHILFPTVTSKMFAWLVSWVRNHGEHHGCSSEVDVWVSGGLDTQNMKGTELDLSWFGF